MGVYIPTNLTHHLSLQRLILSWRMYNNIIGHFYVYSPNKTIYHFYTDQLEVLSDNIRIMGRT